MNLLRNINAFRGHVNGASNILKALHNNLRIIVSRTGDNVGAISALLTMPCGLGDSNFTIQ